LKFAEQRETAAHIGLTSALFDASWRARQQQKSQPRNAAGENFVVMHGKRTGNICLCGMRHVRNGRQLAAESHETKTSAKSIS
jgi:hypothetical protein